MEGRMRHKRRLPLDIGAGERLRLNRLILRLTTTGCDVANLLRQVTPELAHLVPFDACGWLTYGPEALLPVDRLSVDEPWAADLARSFCANEQLDDDVNKFRDLARTGQPANLRVRRPRPPSRRLRADLWRAVPSAPSHESLEEDRPSAFECLCQRIDRTPRSLRVRQLRKHNRRADAE